MGRKRIQVQKGDKFGMWTVTDGVSFMRKGHSYVTVVCECGKVENKSLTSLMRGKTLGCRSCRVRAVKSRKLKIGDVFKNWTIIGGPISSRHQTILWEAKCRCGRTRWFQGNALMNPNANFQCLTCARIASGREITKANGRVGDLTLTRYTRIKRIAKVRNIPFDVSLKFLWDLFISQKQFCAITGDYIDHIDNASLDRIDSTKGYYENNIQWVTIQANKSKHIMSNNELITFCKKVINYANQQPRQS